MKNIKKSLCLLLSTLLITQPIMANQEVVEKKRKSVLYTTLDLIIKRQVIGAQTEALIDQTITERQKFQLKNLKNDYEALKSGELSVEDYLKDLSRENLKKSSIQKKEIKAHLDQLDEYELDIVASQLVGNANYQNELLEYNAAFTRTEKLNALLSANYRDFDYLNSMAQKRISKMTKEQALRAIERTKERVLSQGSNKGDLFTKEEILRALQIAGAVLLVVGVVTWSKYYGDYKDAKKDREGELNTLRNKLQAELDIKTTELTNAELEYLNNNGYQYMQCGSYSRPDSIICSNYSYSLIAGTKYCTVYCYKNMHTGQETLHAPPTCTSPFIPSDCDDPLEYSRGYNAAYNLGYDDGQYDGDDDGWVDGRRDGEDDGYDDGYDDAYNDGYNDGFDDGYWDGSLENVNFSPEISYQRGFEKGREDAALFKSLSGF